MSKRTERRSERRLVHDLERVAAVAGATAAVANTVAAATDRAQDVADTAGDTVAQVAEVTRRSRKGLVLLLALGVVGLVVFLLVRRSSGGGSVATPLADVDAGPAAPIDVAVTTSA